MTYEAGQVHAVDVVVARRIADYITLALSHKGMADEASARHAGRARREPQRSKGCCRR